MAQDIVRALTPVAGKFDKHDEYFESEQLHRHVGGRPPARDQGAGGIRRQARQVELRAPARDPAALRAGAARQDARRASTRSSSLVKRKDVSELINACDAGREGELIFRLIQQHAKSKQPVKRLWLQSMTPAGDPRRLRAPAHRPESCRLAEAARSRSEADWLVGINGTRAMTAFNSRDGGFFLTTVGRVQTPTLSIMVEREEQIRKHVSRDYWEVRATFAVAAGEYEGKWFDPAWKKNPDDAEQRPDRLWNEADAYAIAEAVQGEPATVDRGGQAEHAGAAAALRPDDAAARGQLALRLLGAHDALDRAGALREAQGAHLSADRQPALPEDYVAVARADDRDDLEGEPARAAARRLRCTRRRR